MNKLIKDGMVAVLVSHGYGAGWSTWNSNWPDCVFNPRIVRAILEGVPAATLQEIGREEYPDAYMGGLKDCNVYWVPVGTMFRITEYDGAESLEEFSATNYHLA